MAGRPGLASGWSRGSCANLETRCRSPYTTAVTLAPNLRRSAFTAHVIASVGWLGAVAAFLALAVAGVASHSPQTMGAAYLAMGLVYGWVVGPFGVASVLTGLVSSLGADRGLLRRNGCF